MSREEIPLVPRTPSETRQWTEVVGRQPNLPTTQNQSWAEMIGRQQSATLAPQIQPPSWKEFVHPGLMAIASLTNIVGGFFAIASGADQVKGDDGLLRTNPFFYTAMSTSSLYFSANGYELYRIYNKQQDTWKQIVEQQKAQSELGSVRIDR